MLAGIDVDRSFAEMFTILDSLIEEAEETDNEVLHTQQEMNIHVPPEIGALLLKEARENNESALEHLQKLREWLYVAEEEEENEKGIDRYREREYDTDGSLLPRPEDYSDEEPQGSESSGTIPSTAEAAHSLLTTDDITARLGACQK
jgi:hypothetical protein